MKKYLNILFTSILFIFSFYYTNIISNYIKNHDPIMIKIKANKNILEIKSINAIINNNTIIPGKKGKIIDINKTYTKMKKINKYTESLIVYKEILPDISLKNNFDNLVINGNLNTKNISILIKINNLEILKKLKDDSLNFILTIDFINDNYEYLKILNNNIIVLENNNLTNLNIIDYCYSLETFLNYCKKYHKYTLKFEIITNNYFYNTNLLIQNGKMLAYNIINDQDILELNNIISYLKTLNYKVVSIDTLLKE